MSDLDRFIVVRRKCPFCHMALKAILFVNRYLPYDKRITIMDNYEFEEFGIMAHPVIEHMLDQETFDGYPYIFIDGGVVEPGPTECLIITIGKKVSHDLLREINMDGKIIYPEAI